MYWSDKSQLNWYDFDRNEISVGTISKDGEMKVERHGEIISAEEKAAIAAHFSNYLLKLSVYEVDTYDSSDDERAEDSTHEYHHTLYRSIDLEQDLYGLIKHNGEVRGIVFFVMSGSSEIYSYVYFFDGSVRQQMSMGYSASHSSTYKTLEKVELVKKGEGGAPKKADKTVKFIQDRRYPEF